MKLNTVIRRFLIPSPLITGIYWLKYRCMVSPRAEVDLSPLLKIGKGTRISAFSKIKANGPLTLGSNVSVGTSCLISADWGGVAIGDYSMIGANTTIIGNNYKIDRLDVPMCTQDKTSKGIMIGSDVWIGSGSVILDGSHIGNGTIVAPNSVVSAKIPDHVLVQGNPAKIIFKRR